MNLEGKVVFLTGASAGIGRETALELGRAKATIVLVARRAERLQEVARQIEESGGEAFVLAGDVSDEGRMAEAVTAAVQRFGRIDILINNAGVGVLATVEETTAEHMNHLWNTNVMGTMHCVRHVLPLMKKQNAGQIITISSLSGRRGAPLKSAYCATKFAQTGLIESLRMELTGTNILCTLVYPGATDTEFLSAMENPGNREARFFGPVQSAGKVARAIVGAIGSRKPEIITQSLGRLQVVLNAASPALADWLVRRRKRGYGAKTV